MQTNNFFSFLASAIILLSSVAAVSCDGRLDDALDMAGDDRFISRLRSRFPSLNDDDLHLCMLIKIGLSNEDISNIYCIIANSIKKKLYCFKEKLNITDRSISLRDYINNF